VFSIERSATNLHVHHESRSIRQYKERFQDIYVSPIFKYDQKASNLQRELFEVSKYQIIRVASFCIKELSFTPNIFNIKLRFTLIIVIIIIISPSLHITRTYTVTKSFSVQTHSPAQTAFSEIIPLIMQYQAAIFSFFAALGLSQASVLVERANGKANEYPNPQWLVVPAQNSLGPA
jgi:hypothetical protein